MIIDNEKITRDIMKLSLEQEGYEVENFANGKSALARLREKDFTVVITCLKMRGVDGMGVVRQVKELSPATATIIVTAFANLNTAVEAMREDVHDFFPKPVKMQALKNSIKKALQ
jgi:DNA-binding NtrC family response regulator